MNRSVHIDEPATKWNQFRNEFLLSDSLKKHLNRHWINNSPFIWVPFTEFLRRTENTFFYVYAAEEWIKWAVSRGVGTNSKAGGLGGERNKEATHIRSFELIATLSDITSICLLFRKGST